MMTDIGHMQVLEISGEILLRTSVEGNSNSKVNLKLGKVRLT